LARAQQRLGEREGLVTGIAEDVLTAHLPTDHYAVWHDRAVFHFLTDPGDRARYVGQTERAVRPEGYAVVASFDPDGPTWCGGLEVTRHSPEGMHAEFGASFRLLESVREDHRTASGLTQAFVYCLCRVEG